MAGRYEERVRKAMEEGAQRKCAECEHNGFEHTTGEIDLDAMNATIGDDEKWKAFWSMPTPCRYCRCDNPDLDNRFMRVHENCPNQCPCQDFKDE